MSEDSTSPQSRWKAQLYAIGIVAGAAFGFLAAFMYGRAAQEDDNLSGGKPNPIPTGQLIGLLLTVLGLIRQIAEAGKSPKK